MARMLGRYRTPGCYSGTPWNHRTHHDHPGPDCSGHERSARWRKRVEQREFGRHLAGLADEIGERLWLDPSGEGDGE